MRKEQKSGKEIIWGEGGGGNKKGDDGMMD
jgi:hypothetical protein